ncbi:MAG: hypothetical protein KAT20_02670, partial [Desulfuromonadales bacterium]|nr:hypothetical protein [Desulfuromonadales bacterium]
GDGASSISYELSIDGGDTWVTITHWDIVKRYPLDNNGDPITSTDLAADGVMITDSWTPGTPATTYRSVRIDFSGHESFRRPIDLAGQFYQRQRSLPAGHP